MLERTQSGPCDRQFMDSGGRFGLAGEISRLIDDVHHSSHLRMYVHFGPKHSILTIKMDEASRIKILRLGGCRISDSKGTTLRPLASILILIVPLDIALALTLLICGFMYLLLCDTPRTVRTESQLENGSGSYKAKNTISGGTILSWTCTSSQSSVTHISWMCGVYHLGPEHLKPTILRGCPEYLIGGFPAPVLVISIRYRIAKLRIQLYAHQRMH